MKSSATLLNTWTTLTQNLTSSNQALGLQLMGDQHRYLIQRYFANERTYQTTTVGSLSLNLNAELSAGATSGTLAAAWPYQSCTQLVNFTAPATDYTATTTASLAAGATSATLTGNWSYTTGTFLTTFSTGEQLYVTYTNGSAAVTFLGALESAASTTLTLPNSSDQRTVTFTSGSTSISWAGGLNGFAGTGIGTMGIQRYLIPANISKIKNDTITIGQLRYVPAPVMSRAEWDTLNTLPYNSDIPNYFFIWNGAVEFFPIPSTTGNVISFNYKCRVPEFTTSFIYSTADGAAYSTGAAVFEFAKGSLAGLAAGSTSVTGSSTSWNTTGGFPLNVDVTYFNLYLIVNQPKGEGIWYPISSFSSDTALTLARPISSAASTTTSSNGYAIAQLPILEEDFHDMILYGALRVYFSSVVRDAEQYKMFDGLYQQKQNLLEDYAGTKSVNVDLGAQPPMLNPNLFPYAQTG